MHFISVFLVIFGFFSNAGGKLSTPCTALAVAGLNRRDLEFPAQCSGADLCGPIIQAAQSNCDAQCGCTQAVAAFLPLCQSCLLEVQNAQNSQNIIENESGSDANPTIPTVPSLAPERADTEFAAACAQAGFPIPGTGQPSSAEPTGPGSLDTSSSASVGGSASDSSSVDGTDSASGSAPNSATGTSGSNIENGQPGSEPSEGLTSGVSEQYRPSLLNSSWLLLGACMSLLVISES
ncbi:hypothetical protein CVT26_011838 [Gymnopilus dilepis]|uniref:Extracellular membrane protein CFEM domain-containing protein n=1 Tax=Gymnopilus dilepis TaxID=231916 RepID=A0A409YFW5_9AGAR|nr:hypothetical protein CVT26_011838 [Gymnopilus dilepis]